MAAPSYVYTIALAAEMLGEDEDLLADLAMDLDPEHGRLWIYDTDDRSTLAFTAEGVDNLRELIRDKALTTRPEFAVHRHTRPADWCKPLVRRALSWAATEALGTRQVAPRAPRRPASEVRA